MFSTFVLKEPLKVNHILGFFVVCFGVYIVLNGPFSAVVYAAEGKGRVLFMELAEVEGDGL